MHPCCRHCTTGHPRNEHVTPCPDCPTRKVRQTQELRRSNAAGSHLDSRTKRARTRAASKLKALKEQE